MKKIILVLMSITMLLSLSACGGSGEHMHACQTVNRVVVHFGAALRVRAIIIYRTGNKIY